MAVRKRWSAFTLVELLIVLAIVAILAMVAAPKMIESKVLSQLAQVHKDHRLLKTALDSYFLDYGGYPSDQRPYCYYSSCDSNLFGFNKLTSPIHYLSRVMADPFGNTSDQKPFLSYEGESGSDGTPHSTGSRNPCGLDNHIYDTPSGRTWESAQCIHAYLIASAGPDRREFSTNRDFPYDAPNLRSFSPTNGTESEGDIYLLTGDYHKSGCWLDFVKLQKTEATSTKGGRQR